MTSKCNKSVAATTVVLLRLYEGHAVVLNLYFPEELTKFVIEKLCTIINAVAHANELILLLLIRYFRNGKGDCCNTRACAVFFKLKIVLVQDMTHRLQYKNL